MAGGQTAVRSTSARGPQGEDDGIEQRQPKKIRRLVRSGRKQASGSVLRARTERASKGEGERNRSEPRRKAETPKATSMMIASPLSPDRGNAARHLGLDSRPSRPPFPRTVGLTIPPTCADVKDGQAAAGDARRPQGARSVGENSQDDDRTEDEHVPEHAAFAETVASWFSFETGLRLPCGVITFKSSIVRNPRYSVDFLWISYDCLHVERARFDLRVAAGGTIAAAAEACFMTSAVSAEWHSSAETGVALLERSGRGVRLTDAARRARREHQAYLGGTRGAGRSATSTRHRPCASQPFRQLEAFSFPALVG
jgi:hypothetical protein